MDVGSSTPDDLENDICRAHTDARFVYAACTLLLAGISVPDWQDFERKHGMALALMHTQRELLLDVQNLVREGRHHAALLLARSITEAHIKLRALLQLSDEEAGKWFVQGDAVGLETLRDSGSGQIGVRLFGPELISADPTARNAGALRSLLDGHVPTGRIGKRNASVLNGPMTGKDGLIGEIIADDRLAAMLGNLYDRSSLASHSHPSELRHVFAEHEHDPNSITVQVNRQLDGYHALSFA